MEGTSERGRVHRVPIAFANPDRILLPAAMDEPYPHPDESVPQPEASTSRSHLDRKRNAPPASGARRRFLFESGVLTTSLAAAPYLDAQERARGPERAGAAARTGSITQVRLNVNGRDFEMTLDPRVTLLDCLREHLGLMGTKKGCDRGQCGACTVLRNGRRVNSCLTLALACDGDRVVTVEGLAIGETLHPMQAAFLTRDAFQCGYCTPGQICSAVALLDEAKGGAVSAATPDVRALDAVSLRQLSDDEIRERMSGNICRCGAYVNIVAAVRDVARRGA